MIIEQNSIGKDLWKEKIQPTEQISENIVFSNSFTQKPFILLSLERIDTGQFIEQSNFQKNGQKEEKDKKNPHSNPLQRIKKVV